jgi:hypothetical protein
MLYLNNKTAYLIKRWNLQWIFISDGLVSLHTFDPITCHTKQIDIVQDTDKKDKSYKDAYTNLRRECPS